jgi:hypothetical protein
MTNSNPIRALAKSRHWQIVYSRSKELAQVGLFQNQHDFTPLQVSFLQWLEIYHGLELDLVSNKPHLSREVIDDGIRCDAYLHWREITAGKDEKELTKLEDTSTLHDGAVIFKRKKK